MQKWVKTNWKKKKLYLLVSAYVRYFAWFKIWVKFILNVLQKNKNTGDGRLVIY